MAKSESDCLKPAEVEEWFRDQASAIARVAAMRTQEAADLASAYARGKIPPIEADNRLDAYNERWGDSVNGIFTVEGKTDKDILEEMAARRSGTWLDYVKQRQEVRSKGEGSPPLPSG